MKITDNKSYHYVRRNADEAAIITALGAIANAKGYVELTEQDDMVLAALRRGVPSLKNEPLEKIQEYLVSLGENEDSVNGLVSNVKGILHEMEFIRLENEDGDSVYASMFKSPTHPDTDILFVDKESGEAWEVQLKATDNTAYVQDWINDHPDGEILVTDEIANEMNLPSTGQSNEELTSNVSDFVDKMVAANDESGMWDYFPALSVISVSIVVFELWRRYQSKEIDIYTFKRLAAHATGIKITKIATLIFLLTIPVIGQVTGTLLIAKFLLNTKSTWFDRPPIYVPPEMLPSE